MTSDAKPSYKMRRALRLCLRCCAPAGEYLHCEPCRAELRLYARDRSRRLTGSTGLRRTCSRCDESGHNVRTCPHG